MILDAHCDVLSRGLDPLSNRGHFDIRRAMAAGYSGQVFAAFGEEKEAQLARLRELPEVPGFDLIPAVEGADEIRHPSDLDAYAALGIRMLGLTWNGDNALAGGCGGSGRGLTELGREIVALCERAGIWVDLAHASPRTFDDALACRTRPVVVSHTCCAALNPHRRNLSDAQLRAVAASGGVTGICYYPPFLTGADSADIRDAARHIMHAVHVAGADHVGLGSDFDGCSRLPSGLQGVEDVPRLIESLPLNGSEREKVAGGNWRRLLLSAGAENPAAGHPAPARTIYPEEN